MSEPLDSITNNDELEDGTEETHFTLAPMDTKLLTSPTDRLQNGQTGTRRTRST